MQDVQSLTTRKSELLNAEPSEMEALIIENLGLRVCVKKHDGKMYIMIQTMQSCFRLTEKLRFDFDFSIHKREGKYVIEI